MESAQIPAFPQPHLAAIPQLREKPRLGFERKNPALHPGHTVCNSTTALGVSWSAASGTRQSDMMGRFMTPDWAAKPTTVPYADFGDPQSLNLYGYVRNNPLSTIDPDGHCCLDEISDFVNGALNAYGSDNLLGAGRVDQSSLSYRVGQVIGDGAAMAEGALQVGAGVAGDVAGTALAATGVGALPGAAIDVVATAAAVQGAATFTVGATHLMKDGSPQNTLGGGQLGEANGPKAGSTGGRGSGEKFSPGERNETLKENKGKCVFCGKPATEADHAFPRSRGGDRTPENRQPTCVGCNRSKGAKTSEEFLRKKQEQQ